MEAVIPSSADITRSRIEQNDDLWLKLVANFVGPSRTRNDFENSNKDFWHWLFLTSRLYLGAIGVGILISAYKSGVAILDFFKTKQLSGSSISDFEQIGVLVILVVLMYTHRPSSLYPSPTNRHPTLHARAFGNFGVRF